MLEANPIWLSLFQLDLGLIANAPKCRRARHLQYCLLLSTILGLPN